MHNVVFFLQSKDELEKCGKTVYCTNIDKEVALLCHLLDIGEI